MSNIVASYVMPVCVELENTASDSRLAAYAAGVQGVQYSYCRSGRRAVGRLVFLNDQLDQLHHNEQQHEHARGATAAPAEDTSRQKP